MSIDLEDEKEVHDVYEVWFAYLIRTPHFRDYLKSLRSGASMRLSNIDEFGSGYHHWIYHLLPDLWKNNPDKDSFSHVWRAWCRRFKKVDKQEAVKDFPWDQAGESITNNIMVTLDIFREREDRDPENNELSELIKNSVSQTIKWFKDPQKLMLQVNHNEHTTSYIQSAFNDRLGIAQAQSVSNNELTPPLGLMLRNETETDQFNKCRYNVPIINRDHLYKGYKKTLNRLKRQLNIFELIDSGFNVESIASGCFDEDFMPFDDNVFMSTDQGITILECQIKLRPTGDFTKIPPASEIPAHLKTFVKNELFAAKQTLSAVQEGWFPTFPPQKS